jgi:hypothetical protein
VAEASGGAKLSSISRHDLKIEIGKREARIKNRIIEIVEKLDIVLATSDIWSSRRKSYIGVTLHWVILY